MIPQTRRDQFAILELLKEGGYGWHWSVSFAGMVSGTVGKGMNFDAIRETRISFLPPQEV
jgi:hypothetical protein